VCFVFSTLILFSGRDVLARAKNGTGKTAAFCIPTIQLINPAVKKIQGIDPLL